VDGSKCISYFTIELKENIPQEMKGKFEDWVFGCDICQDVCPWNKFSKPHNEPLFNPNIDVLSMTRKTGTKSPKKLLGGIQRFSFKKNKI
jgi:epoxyqueuosine reductase